MPFSYFTDPVLRAPTIGSMLMCLAAALVGVIVFLRKQSLLGESLSHAAYPGVICGMLLSTLFKEPHESLIPLFVLIGAFFSALLGLYSIYLLERYLKVRSDSALCFVLSAFFGIGLTLASQVQFTHSTLYNQIQVYLYGQAATMTDAHMITYALLAGIILFTILLFYKELQIMIFDSTYASSMGIPVKKIDLLIFILTVLSVVMGIRSVGIVLMSAMLIAPPAAARQYTNRLSVMLLLAGCFGIASGFLGNYISTELNEGILGGYFILPTGPMIVIIASILCLFSLFFSPRRGMLWRIVRSAQFRYRCLCENLLKTMWRHGPKAEVTINTIKETQSVSNLYLRFILFRLCSNGWLDQIDSKTFKLTAEGEKRAARIIRLHRLWEVYLVEYLGMGVERVHRNAEEMEHILTPELEQELTLLLKNPQHDPHQQPIPPPGYTP